jgi:hypothetical protein
VRRLHGIFNDPDQVAAQSVQVHLVPQPDVESGQDPRSVVLPPIEAAIYETLEASTQGLEKGGYGEGGGHDSKLGFLSGQRSEAELQGDHTTEIDQR